MKNRQRRAVPKAGRDLSKKLYISLLSILVCTVCLASTTWAWYAGTDSAAVAGIQIASYQVTAEITGPDETPVEMVNGSCTFEAGTQYTVKLSLSTESTATTGYCVLRFGEGSTQTVKTALVGTETGTETLTFTAAFNENTTFTLAAFWGDPPEGADQIRSGDQIGGYTLPTQTDPNPEDQPETTGSEIEPATSQEPTEPTTPADTTPPAEATEASESQTEPTEATEASESQTEPTEATEASESQTEPAETTEASESQTEPTEQTPPTSGDATDPTDQVRNFAGFISKNCWMRPDRNERLSGLSLS